MCLPSQETSWPSCMGGQAAPEARHRAVNCQASAAAPQEAEPSSAIRELRIDKELGSQQPLQQESLHSVRHTVNRQEQAAAPNIYS